MVLPAFITATLTAFFCGILIKFSYVSFYVVLIAIVVGDLLSNIFWYILGLIGGRAFLITFGRIFGITQVHLNDTMSVFNKFKDYLAFFVSAPLGMAIMFISLMDAGIRKHGFLKYILTNTFVSILWIWLILGVGYCFGYCYVTYISITSRVLTSIMLLITIFILLTFGAWLRTIIISNISKLSS